MSNTNIKNNPYTPQRGYDNNHDVPISGFGITIESIQAWLFDHQLNTTMIGYQKATGENPDEATEDEIDNWLSDQIDSIVINYVTTATGKFTGLMGFSADPERHGAGIAPAGDQINVQIVDAVQILYQVPDDLIASLTKFVDKYSDFISVCDYS